MPLPAPESGGKESAGGQEHGPFLQARRTGLAPGRQSALKGGGSSSSARLLQPRRNLPARPAPTSQRPAGDTPPPHLLRAEAESCLPPPRRTCCQPPALQAEAPPSSSHLAGRLLLPLLGCHCLGHPLLHLLQALQDGHAELVVWKRRDRERWMEGGRKGGGRTPTLACTGGGVGLGVQEASLANPPEG